MVNHRLVSEFATAFSAELDRWCAENCLAPLNCGFQPDPDKPERYVIGGTVEHQITHEMKQWYFFIEDGGKVETEDIHPVLADVTDKLKSAFWPEK